MSVLRKCVLVPIVAWALVACSTDEGDSLAALGVKDGASRGVSKSIEISAGKSAAITLATGAQLLVPKGAVEKNLTITMERPADAKALDLVEKFKQDQDRIASAPYVLKPHGTQFNEEVTLTLPLAKGGAREVAVAWLEDENDTEWKVLGVASSDGKKAEIALKHFSVLIVVEDASDLEPAPDLEGVRPATGGRVDAGASNDAGSSSAGDASVDELPDAGSTTIDAGTVAVQDAGGRDASGPAPMLDGGTGISDASGGGTGADASGPVAPDASREAGTTPPDAGVAQTQYEQLSSCGLWTATGGFSEGGWDTHPWESEYSLCVHNCFMRASCLDAQIYRCNIDTSVSVEVASCVSTCTVPYEYCPENPQVPVLRCDGSQDCLDGRDELKCDPSLFFDCGGGERITLGWRCDGELDCAGGNDEQGCFSCDGGAVLAPMHVCDGVMDCGDGTDEANCAEISCSIITQ